MVIGEDFIKLAEKGMVVSIEPGDFRCYLIKLIQVFVFVPFA